MRKSSSYYESLVALNRKFAAEKKPPVKLKEAPETLEDEDLLEMLNAGLVALVVVDKHIADFWKQVFPKLAVHDDIAVRTGGEIAWAIRKSSPQLKASLDELITPHKVGTATGNQLLTRYLKSVTYVKNAASEKERKKFLYAGPVFPQIRRPLPRGLAADGRAGLPGVAARPECKKPGWRDRSDAANARHGQGHEGG